MVEEWPIHVCLLAWVEHLPRFGDMLSFAINETH